MLVQMMPWIMKRVILSRKYFKLKVPNCKVIISRPIKRNDNDNASRVKEEVIAQFQKVTIDMEEKENLEKKQLRKRGLHLNDFGLTKFVQNLIAGCTKWLWVRVHIGPQNKIRLYFLKRYQAA